MVFFHTTKIKQQHGQASLEYIIVCAALVAALLAPVTNEKNIMEICSEALQEWYTAFAYSKSLSVLPNLN
ncbi:hypothetical protein [Shewanella frigidimarina]|uniref:Pilin n=1 Tax=Shewanella frigidimarina TaxID=56812 RepID=A0A106BZL8_SHEFR|nr:hypothetical protein [Shewanella frigidimarina]KVX01521.1 hypothetical protein AWJ07_17435 [Shewanella frigidimarina]